MVQLVRDKIQNSCVYIYISIQFTKGFTKVFKTENHPKAKGLDLQINVPISWYAREGKRPNVVQFFNNQNDFGDASLAFLIKDIEDGACDARH